MIKRYLLVVTLSIIDIIQVLSLAISRLLNGRTRTATLTEDMLS